MSIKQTSRASLDVETANRSISGMALASDVASTDPSKYAAYCSKACVWRVGEAPRLANEAVRMGLTQIDLRRWKDTPRGGFYHGSIVDFGGCAVTLARYMLRWHNANAALEYAEAELARIKASQY